MKKIFTFLILAVASISLFAQTAVKPKGDGVTNPYQISTWQNLYWLSQTPDEWNASFVQTKDIIFPDDINQWDNGKGWAPLGSSSEEFTGIYDGKGHSIKNLYINRQDLLNAGLFSYIYTAVIRNLGVEGYVKGKDNVGMLVGYSKTSNIENCYAIGEVIASGQQAYSGGLVGVSINNSNIIYSYTKCILKPADPQDAITGGLVGINNESGISHSYSISKIEIAGSYSDGFVGESVNAAGKYSRNFFDKDISGFNQATGATSLSTAEMKQVSNFPWDFNDIWQIDPFLNEGYPTLQVFGVSGITGKGTEKAPYLISDWNHLKLLSEAPEQWDKYYRQTADMIFPAESEEWNNGAGFSPIGNADIPFSGAYNGGMNSISNLIISRNTATRIGLFGSTSNAAIDQLQLVDVKVAGGHLVGALVGLAVNTFISECSSTGTITALNGKGGGAGGLVASLTETSEILNSNSRCAVTGAGGFNSYAGGLVGSVNNSKITHSYSTGKVAGENAGGLVGKAVDIAGGKVTRSFWDTKTSDTDVSAAGMGKVTEEMKDIKTYSEWDFSTIWAMDENHNDGYPYFKLSPTNMKASEDVAISAFPNPFSSQVFIINTGEVTTVSFINLAGQTVIEKNLNGENAIATESLAKGVYLVRVQFIDGSVQTIKMTRN
jgi:hypothetical protein